MGEEDKEKEEGGCVFVSCRGEEISVSRLRPTRRRREEKRRKEGLLLFPLSAVSDSRVQHTHAVMMKEEAK